jgi:outer membrane protein assembly factor BamB
MKMLAGGLVTLLLMVTPVPAQVLSRHYSNPSAPPRQTLDRVNLELAWRTYLPVEGRRDGLFSFQQLDQKQIVVQTVSGMIVSLDAATGIQQWKTRVGNPYQAARRVGFNSRQIFALRGDKVFAVDRASGRLLWLYKMPTGGAAAPLADEYGLYLTLANGRIYAYALPDLEEWKRKRKDQAKGSAFVREKSASLDLYAGTSGLSIEKLVELLKEVGPEPEMAWDLLFEAGRVSITPVQSAEALLSATSNGWIFAMAKFERHERFRLQADAPVAAPLGQHGDIAYIASEDYNVYAVDIAADRVRVHWRFITGSPILQKPAVTDKDVFVVSERRGLFRINRANGREVWRSSSAYRFLAASPKFVYAFDRQGRLLVLDYARGSQLGVLATTRDFVFPIANELNDRLFLAAHNGLLVCLHDHNLKTPVVSKTIAEKKVEGFKKDEDKLKPKEDKKPKDDKKKLGEEDKPKDDKKKDKDKDEKEKE